MRILTVGNLYPPYHHGGYELVWQTAVRALRAAGHEVLLLATEERLGRAPDLAEEDEGVHRELRWYWRDHAFPRRAPWQVRAIERHNRAVLDRHLAAFAPDVVSWWAMGGMSLSLLARPSVPGIGWVNDGWPIYGPQVDPWSRRHGVPLDGVDRWVFCSELARSRTVEEVGPLASTVVHHQGPSALFASAPPRAWEGRILYAGRLDERKGLGTLLDALRELPDMTLRVVGDGDEREAARLRERAPGNVTFVGQMDRAALAAEYAAADAVAFPVEWTEPWGLVPLEAMAVGRPVVATGRGGSGEYLEHEANALLFEAGDAAALAAALRRLASDPGLRERLRASGLATAGRISEPAWAACVVREHEQLGR